MKLIQKRHVYLITSRYHITLEMKREEIAAHLESCPASVVVCMAEWNRWPVYSKDRVSGRGTMRTKNPYASEGQLGNRKLTKC